MGSVTKTASIVLALLVGTVLFQDHTAYSTLHRKDPAVWTDVLCGTAYAPAQYRIGVLEAADFLSRKLHIALHQGLTAIDLIAGLVTVGVLFYLFVHTEPYRTGDANSRWFGAAIFCFLTWNCLAWLTWYIRPETLTSSALLAVTSALIQTLKGKSYRRVPIVAAMITLATAAGVVRADVIATFHLGVLIVCFNKIWRGDAEEIALGWRLQAMTSAVCLLVCAGLQGYLMYVRYPGAVYDSHGAWMLRSNLTQPLEWAPFVLAFYPYLWTSIAVVRGRVRLTGADAGLQAGAALFFAVWLSLGRVQEVRIFLPYALASLPLTAATVMNRRDLLTRKVLLPELAPTHKEARLK